MRFNQSWKHWWCEWHGGTRAGATIVSSVLSPTWAIICRIKLLEIFCAVRGLPRRRSEAELPHGRTLSPRIRTFWRVLTSLSEITHCDVAIYSRQALIARLEETAQGGLFQWETNRRARVVEELDRTRRQLGYLGATEPPTGLSCPVF